MSCADAPVAVVSRWTSIATAPWTPCRNTPIRPLISAARQCTTTERTSPCWMGMSSGSPSRSFGKSMPRKRSCTRFGTWRIERRALRIETRPKPVARPDAVCGKLPVFESRSESRSQIRSSRREEALENDEIRMSHLLQSSLGGRGGWTNVERMSKHQCPNGCGLFTVLAFVIGISDLFRHWEFVIRHSYLSATIGSTLAARRAGSQQATSATATSRMAMPTNVSGSVGVTS